MGGFQREAQDPRKSWCSPNQKTSRTSAGWSGLRGNEQWFLRCSQKICPRLPLKRKILRSPSLHLCTWIPQFIPADPQFIPASSQERHQWQKDSYIANIAGWIVKRAKKRSPMMNCHPQPPGQCSRHS